MASDNISDLEKRKADHIEVVLGRDVGFGRLTTGFEQVQFEHNALPELSLEQVDISTSFLGRAMAAPLLISSMTGGPDRAANINENLSIAAEALGIALGVGSQRIALEEQGDGGLSRALRSRAPSIPLIGNIGAAQLLDDKSVERARAAMAMIDADGLFVHLNPLQEAVQRGGDTDWRGALTGIEALVRDGIPVIIKEVGFGLSVGVIRQLTDIGVSSVDVAGAGGTNWARVEGERDAGSDPIAATFTEWGIPTATAVRDARCAFPDLHVIASGGIKDGVDVAKAIRLGADMVGQAAATLTAAMDSPEAVIGHFEKIIDTLKIACFATGSASLADLKVARLIDLGRS